MDIANQRPDSVPFAAFTSNDLAHMNNIPNENANDTSSIKIQDKVKHRKSLLEKKILFHFLFIILYN